MLAAKLLLVPSLILLLSLAQRRWGAGLAGWLSAFPVYAGPVLLILSVEQGHDFAAQAAEGTLYAIVATLAFCIAYGWTCLRHGVLLSLLAAALTYALTVSILQFVYLPLLLAFLVVLGLLTVAPYALPKRPPPTRSAPPGTIDLVLRMALGATMVLLVTYFADVMGPRTSGLFGMFPLMSTVLVTFSHHHAGPDCAVALLRGMFYGFYGFASFCVVMTLVLPGHGLLASFAAGLSTVLALQLISKRLMPKNALGTDARS